MRPETIQVFDVDNTVGLKFQQWDLNCAIGLS